MVYNQKPPRSTVLKFGLPASLFLSFFVIQAVWCTPYGATGTPVGILRFNTTTSATGTPTGIVTIASTTYLVVPVPLEEVPAIKTPPVTAEPVSLGMFDPIVLVYEKFEKQALAQNHLLQTALNKLVEGVVTVMGLTIQERNFSFSLLKLIAFLQLALIQPLILGIPRRKQPRWGEVYDSVSKRPLDLTTVRLINRQTNTVIQSKVTDSLGRYAFMVGQGKYYIEVVNRAYKFPSVLLKNNTNDGEYADLYHGETISVSAEEGVVAVNIPIDPAGERLRPANLLREQWYTLLKNGISWAGLLIAIVAFALSAGLYMGIFLLLQVAVFIGERVKARPRKTKSWGVVYDAKTKKPLARVVARLYNLQFNKLIASQVTDSRGRYYFLVGGDEYYLTFEHNDYLPQKSEAVDMKGKMAETITLNVGLKKNIAAVPLTALPETTVASPVATPTTLPVESIAPLAPPTTPAPPAPTQNSEISITQPK